MLIEKIVNSLPTTLQPNTIYLVLQGSSNYDIVITDNTGSPQGKTLLKKEFKPSSVVNDIDDDFIYKAWEKNTGGTYEAVRYSLSNGLLSGMNTGTLPIPSDLKILTYT